MAAPLFDGNYTMLLSSKRLGCVAREEAEMTEKGEMGGRRSALRPHTRYQ